MSRKVLVQLIIVLLLCAGIFASPGLADMACFEVNTMKAVDKVRRGVEFDTYKIKGRFRLADCMSFNASTDDVTVRITPGETPDDVLTVLLPAGSFVPVGGADHYKFNGEIPEVGNVRMHLHFDECLWWIRIKGQDAS